MLFALNEVRMISAAKTISEDTELAKKKNNGLSIAIVALNIVIVGIIILLIFLVYLHMREDIDNGRENNIHSTGSETVPAEESSDISFTSPSDVSQSSVPEASGSDETTESEATSEEMSDTSATSVTVNPLSYNKSFYDNCFFIGDSISTGLYLYGFLDKDNVFAEVGLNPESALTHEIDGVTCSAKAQALDPERIYIMLGTNGLAYMDGEYMANKMVELIAQLETACPVADIYVISIPPVTAAHEAEGNETMSKVLDYNSKLKERCQEGGFTYIDLCSVLQDETGYMSANYAEADGLHFLGAAYIRMLNYVEQCSQ